jgi:RNA polymerase sigma-70 factor (ECF subfamily)
MDQPSHDSDGALLRALAQRQGDALAELVRRYEDVLLKHARALLGSGGPFEDAVQDTFLRLFERPPQLSGAGPEAESAQLRSWLHTVLRNCCMDTLRSDERRRQREHAAAGHEPAPRSRAGGAEQVEQDDTRAAVERELARLPLDQREVLVLRLVGERSYREIAEITGRKVGTVGWLISEGLKPLSEKLAPLAGGIPRSGALPGVAGLARDGRA